MENKTTLDAALYDLQMNVSLAVTAFQFICFDGNRQECSLNNLSPNNEGTFVLQHIPHDTHILTFAQLQTTTIDHVLLGAMPPFVTSVLVSDSYCVTNLVVPANTTFTTLRIVQTNLRNVWIQKNSNLPQLIIERAQLQHIPAFLVMLRSLVYVKISFTPLNHLDVQLFCNFAQLQIVDLRDNRIESVAGSEHIECSSPLVELLHRNNRLSQINPTVFAPFRNLILIDLSYNIIESIKGRFINTEIEQLIMKNNLLTQIDLCEWNTMPNMSYLYLEKNKLTSVPKCLDTLPNLYSISLEHNLLSNVTLDVFTPLKSLQYLRLSWNPIMSLTLCEASFPPSLMDIDVRFSNLEHLNVSQELLQKGTFVFNHVPNTTKSIVFKNLINLPIVARSLFANIPPSTKTIKLSESSEVKTIVVPNVTSIQELTIAEPTVSRILFQPNGTLSRLIITASSLTTVPPTLHNLVNLSFLKLSQSPLEHISLDRFCNFSKLDDLNLRNNLIATLSFRSSAPTQCCPSLVKLTIGSNKLKSINMTLFASMRALAILDLEYNAIETVVGRFTNPSIKTVVLSNNNLLSINLCDWNTMPLIVSFSFVGNSLLRIPRCLGRMPRVKFINFNHNKLTRISLEPFAMLNELRSLFFSSNAIREVVPTKDGGVPVSLQEIYLNHSLTFDHSIINHIPAMTETLKISDSRPLLHFFLPRQCTIHRLIIAKTNLNWIHFQTNDAVSMVTIVSSNLQMVPPSLRNLQNVRHIKLQKSYIRYLNLDLLQWLSKLDTLDLMYNKIHTIACTLKWLEQRSLLALNLRSNQLKMLNLEILPVIGLFEHVDLSHNKIELLVGRFSSDYLASLMVTHNRLKAVDFCQWEPIPSLERLSFEANELSTIPNCMHHLSNLTYISFAKNKLSQVNMDDFGAMENLTTLDFSANRISLITFREESYPVQLSTLVLRDNKPDCRFSPDKTFCPVDVEFKSKAPFQNNWTRQNSTFHRQLVICYNQSMIHPLFFLWLLSLSSWAVGFKWQCDESHAKMCTISYLGKVKTDLTMLKNITKGAKTVRFARLTMLTLDQATIKLVSAKLKNLEIIDSNPLQTLIVPTYLAITDLFIQKTQLSWIHFQPNDAIVMVSIMFSKLQQIPPSMKYLKNLQYIALQHSHIQHLSLDLLKWCSLLDTVDLMFNNIHTITSTLQSGHQRRLKALVLHHNQLTVINLEVLTPIGWFTYIDLSFNKIELLVGRFTGDHVTSVSFAYNRLKTVDFCQWERVSNLALLSFLSNELSRVPNCMNHLSNLESLSFASNKLTSVSMDAFADMDNLTKLYLSNNTIREITFHEDRHPKRLKQLDISHNKIKCDQSASDKPFCSLDIDFQPSSKQSAWGRNKSDFKRQLIITV
uniref:Uncharacterized protein n=1 Tax=Anopheles epiroticus TaxID=199890 RepID=A0A182P0G5_9DIPT